jgi:hypothetical protein
MKVRLIVRMLLQELSLASALFLLLFIYVNIHTETTIWTNCVPR